MAAAIQWGHLTTPASVQLATQDITVTLTLTIACLQSAQTTVCVWMELTLMSVFVILILC